MVSVSSIKGMPEVFWDLKMGRPDCLGQGFIWLSLTGWEEIFQVGEERLKRKERAGCVQERARDWGWFSNLAAHSSHVGSSQNSPCSGYTSQSEARQLIFKALQVITMWFQNLGGEKPLRGRREVVGGWESGGRQTCPWRDVVIINDAVCPWMFSLFCRASVWLLRYEEALHQGLFPVRPAMSVAKLWVVVRTLYYNPLKVSIMALTQLARISSTALKNFQRG